jgi:MoaA/NifB/PqqE/SkfB family radical SAM enzyme
MEIRYKKDFYNHAIDKLLPGELVAGYATFWTDWHLHRIDRLYAPKVAEVIEKTVVPVPSWVEIETVSRCNNDCAFCPVNVHDDPRPRLYMTDELFEKIIGEFAAMDYRGCIAIFCNNEPLLDPKIIDRIAYAKKMLPRAFHFLYSNGMRLTDEKFVELMKHLD